MIETLARLGYASKALIYAIVGCLAVAAALNRGGRITDTRGALRVLLTQPLGNTMLWVVAIGLCGYAVWRVLDAFFDPDRHGVRFAGIVVRVGNLVRALAYGAIGLEAFRLARGLRASSSGQTSRQTHMWTARVMDLPFGEWLVALVGVIVVGYGIWEIIKAVRQKTDKSVDPTELPVTVRAALVNTARLGVMARASVIIVLGVFLARAALQHDPSEVLGPREGIIELVGIFHSRWALGAIGLGLIAYGVDQAVHAWCRRIRSPI
jgi:uncharacterized protein DUF1206